MISGELDNVDKGILYLLQRNARRNTTTEIGEKTGVSSSTVGNRINKLEERGVIKGYHPAVDYKKTELRHHFFVGATVPLEEQDDIVDEVMDVTGVVTVHELLTNDENVLIEVVAPDQEKVEQALTDLSASGVEVGRTEILKETRTQPYNHFGKQFTSEEDPG